MGKRIGLLAIDSKIPNLALMKLSAWHKAQGDTVLLNNFGPADVDHVYCSVIFQKSRRDAEKMGRLFPSIQFGGSGWDLTTTLPEAVESMRPDYDLYTADILYPNIKGIGTKEKKMAKAQQLVDMGLGKTSTGCVRQCPFCIVPEKEGKLQQVAEIKDIINPRSNIISLLDNNLAADPLAIDKLREIKERDLIVDINQGLDVRLMTPELAKALSEVKHLRSLHYAWDITSHENMVMKGIGVLSQFVKRYRHMCFMLVGHSSTFQEDMYRFHTLREQKVDPFVMIYNFNEAGNVRLKHFARWVNGRIYKKCSFEDYDPWRKAQQKFGQESLLGAVA